MNWIWRLTLIAIVLSVSPHTYANDSPEMTVVVCNRAGLRTATLKDAEAHATRIFANAGIKVEWSESCTPSSRFHYPLIVICRKAPRGWASREALGLAPVRTGPLRRAYIFNNRLEEMMQMVVPPAFRRSSVSIVLGHAIAHEIAHLLIPGDAHTKSGIMTERWGYEEWWDAAKGKLLFSPPQADVMQTRLLDSNIEDTENAVLMTRQ